MPITAVIVEDSRLARQGLKKMLALHSEIDIVAEAEDVEQGIAAVGRFQPQLLFLDIDMPGKNGFDLLNSLSYQPYVIFTTAFSEYAVKSFEYNTVDYLLKPIMPERLAKALSKISSGGSEDSDVRLTEESRIFVRDKDRSHIVSLKFIRKFESCGNHTRIYFEDKAPFIYKSLSKVEERLPGTIFFRINRQLIVNLQFSKSLDELGGKHVLNMTTGETLTISRGQFSRLKELFSL